MQTQDNQFIAYREGFKASTKDKSITENPYVGDLEGYWRAGFTDGQAMFADDEEICEDADLTPKPKKTKREVIEETIAFYSKYRS